MLPSSEPLDAKSPAASWSDATASNAPYVLSSSTLMRKLSSSAAAEFRLHRSQSSQWALTFGPRAHRSVMEVENGPFTKLRLGSALRRINEEMKLCRSPVLSNRPPSDGPACL